MTPLESALAEAKLRGLVLYPHRFGRGSEANLAGVLPALVDVARLAIQLCPYDGTVIPGGGLRSAALAQIYADTGTGIANSLHRRQPDGWGHAIDLIALSGGRIDWSPKAMPAFRAMAKAVKTAAVLLDVPIRQGCDWNMNGLLGEPGTKEYDWPHFEWAQTGVKNRAMHELARYRRVELGWAETGA